MMPSFRNDSVKTEIDAYVVSLDFFVENDEQRCCGQVDYKDRPSGAEFSGSLALLDAFGHLDPDSAYVFEPHRVSQKTQDKIMTWALDNGY